jgi:error-prone DNA polymerase
MGVHGGGWGGALGPPANPYARKVGRRKRLPHPLRLGLRYARGLREEAARVILRARAVRPFTSVDDLAVRVRELRKDELNRLAEIGALNTLEKQHRRDTLWQAQRAILPVGPLLAPLEETGEPSPLAPMSTEERLWADYRGTGLTVGKHPMAWRRIEMNALGVVPAMHLARIPNGRVVRIAGSVVVRQRPGTAKGFVFLSMEDETGMMNAIVNPATFEHFKFEVLGEPYLIIDGVLQNQDGVISVKAGARGRPTRGRRAGVARFPLRCNSCGTGWRRTLILPRPCGRRQGRRQAAFAATFPPCCRMPSLAG